MAVLAAALLVIAGCSGGGNNGGGGSFALIQFLESGKDSIARNRTLTFRFSDAVDPSQDFFERLKIQNVQTANGQSDFSRARGVYIINADTVLFVPLLPQEDDRSDSGFKGSANYHVFLKGGPDALQSAGGDGIPLTQEFLFDTDENFEDPIPTEPPRAFELLARDVTTGNAASVARLDPDPTTQAGMTSADVIAAGNAIDPGAGGAPNYSTPWQFELHISEPLDPQTVNTENVEMLEIANGSQNGPETAVNFKVPILVDAVQTIDAQGQYTVYVRVRPIQTLIDNARYRLSFSGKILGIDFRKQFTGDNGLTGDGLSVSEPGGLGYTTEFVVNDRPAISASRTLRYDPENDGIMPEAGQTTPDESLWNTALYNPLTDPGKAVGFLSAFGNGRDGPLSVAAGQTQTIDTGDVPNEELGVPFSVVDVNPDDEFNTNTLPGANVEWGNGATDSNGDPVHVNPLPSEIQADSMIVSSSGTLRVIGKNPLIVRVAGIAQITGTIDLSGGDGANAGGAIAAGGEAGAGGFPGGSSAQGDNSCSYFFSSSSCTGFQSYLNSCLAARNIYPGNTNGFGPGRGQSGGAVYHDYSSDETNNLGTSGGGGGSHFSQGTAGEDRGNGSTVGSQGTKCSLFVGVRMAGYIGVRSQPGPTYGDPNVNDIYLGGSGGGPGGETYVYNFGSNQQAGGAGGGGGGSITVIASGTIIANGGVIDASGGDGGRGNMKNGSTTPSFVWAGVAGGGGGGAGGTIALISGDDIQLTAAIVTTAGGAGGARGNAGTPTNCSACNAGGDGGKGFIFLMDADGQITGFVNGSPGDYDLPIGHVRISAFDASRFSSIAAVTELFPMPAANPSYQPLDATGVLGNVNPGQSIFIHMSSSYADADDPLSPDLSPGTENPPVHVATIAFSGGGASVTLENPMSDLNPFGIPQREAFVRVRADFDYTNGVEAALGPFASMDEITIDISFNG